MSSVHTFQPPESVCDGAAGTEHGTSPSPVSADNLITGTNAAVHLPQKKEKKV